MIPLLGPHVIVREPSIARPSRVASIARPSRERVRWEGKEREVRRSKNPSEDAGPFPVGETTEISIYPDGREGKEFAVAVFVDVEIIPGSVRDMIQVTVDDATVNVFGTAIPGLEVEFQR